MSNLDVVLEVVQEVLDGGVDVSLVCGISFSEVLCRLKVVNEFSSWGGVATESKGIDFSWGEGVC